MESRQSDARNKVIAPVFKRLGIIDQWGNGLKMVAEEMKQYPEIELHWQEVGLSFQVQLIKKEYKNDIIGGDDGNGGNIGGDGGNHNIKKQITILILQNDRISVQEIADSIGISKRNCERIISELKKNGIISRVGSARTGKWIVNNQ